MSLKEYIAHQLIGTPIEGLAHRLRAFSEYQKRAKYPELQEVYLEASRIELALPRIIHRSMNCIDIGAHLGSVLNAIKHLAPEGTHIAIEPVPYKYQWLKQKFPDVRVLQIALSDSIGEVEFFLQPQSSGFSGLRPHVSGEAKKAFEILKVTCQRLDNIVPIDLPIGFIKLDVEGAELAVLRGGESLLNRSKPTILFECTQSGLEAHTLSLEVIYAFFEDHAYSIFLIKDWLEDGEPLNYERFARATQYPFQAFNFLAISNRGDTPH
jgi:FkbM family methyltransferase